MSFLRSLLNSPLRLVAMATNAASSHSSQRTTGLRSILSIAPLYRLAQRAIGADRSRRELVRNILEVRADDRILDIGCGTADILDLLPLTVDYIGFDPSERYIADARQRFGDRGTFTTAGTERFAGAAEADRSLVMAIGVFHHLNDEGVHSALELASLAMEPGGRLVTIDPTFADGQHPIGRFLAKRDRGEHVRSPEQTLELARRVFPDASVGVRHDLLRVPYSHVVLHTNSALRA